MSSRIFSLLILAGATINAAKAQGLLNKIKNKANQEVNKLEKGANPSSPTQGSNKNKMSANVTRTVVVSLNADEVFDYGENCIDLGTSLSQVSFIVTKRNGSTTQCYTYKNGTRTPTACPTGANSGCQTSLQCSYSQLRELDLGSDEIKKFVANQTATNNVQTPTISDAQLNQMAAYMTPAQLDEVKKSLAAAAKQMEGKTVTTITSSSINFKGKKYGPFKQVVRFFLTQDAKHFYAIGMTSEGQYGEKTKYNVITSASDKTLSSVMFPPSTIIVAPDNSEFAIFTTADAKKYQIITSSGKSIDVPNQVWFHSAWYTATGNHIITYVKDELHLDGALFKTFDANSTYDPCNLFISSDGKGVTIVKDNKLSFPDGDYFEYPLKMALVNTGGKTYFKWLALENQEVVVYQKPY